MPPAMTLKFLSAVQDQLAAINKPGVMAEWLQQKPEDLLNQTESWVLGKWWRIGALVQLHKHAQAMQTPAQGTQNELIEALHEQIESLGAGSQGAGASKPLAKLSHYAPDSSARTSQGRATYPVAVICKVVRETKCLKIWLVLVIALSKNESQKINM